MQTLLVDYGESNEGNVVDLGLTFDLLFIFIALIFITSSSVCVEDGVTRIKKVNNFLL